MKDKILIFSPHIDDAMLSLGGTIQNWIKQEILVTIVYVNSISPYVNAKNLFNIPRPYDFSFEEINCITNMRKAEEKEIIKKCLYEVEYLDFFDKPLTWGMEKDLIKEAVKNRLKGFTGKVFFPLSYNCPHIDHQNLFNIGRDISFPSKAYYEDSITYTPPEYNVKNEVRVPYDVVISEIDVDQKIKLLRLYKSQMDNRVLNRIREHAYFKGKYYERYWVEK